MIVGYLDSLKKGQRMNAQEIRRATKDGINDAVTGFCKSATAALLVVGAIAGMFTYPLIAVPAVAVWGVCMMALSENNVAHWVGFNTLRVTFYGALFAGVLRLIPLLAHH